MIIGLVKVELILEMHIYLLKLTSFDTLGYPLIFVFFVDIKGEVILSVKWMQNGDALLASIFMFKMQIYYFSSFIRASGLASLDIGGQPRL